MQILGMPLDAWLLLLASIGGGLGLKLAYMRARRRDRHDGEDERPARRASASEQR